MSPEADSTALSCTQEYYQTPKYQLSGSPYHRELTSNFLPKIVQILLVNDRNWGHFVTRYLKDAVSSEPVNVAFASMQYYYQLEKQQLSRSPHDAERVMQTWWNMSNYEQI